MDIGSATWAAMKLNPLVVLLGFLEDRREIGFSHHSTKVRMRLRCSAGAEKLNQREAVNWG
jgi:hypothetical protein